MDIERDDDGFHCLTLCVILIGVLLADGHGANSIYGTSTLSGTGWGHCCEVVFSSVFKIGNTCLRVHVPLAHCEWPPIVYQRLSSPAESTTAFHWTRQVSDWSPPRSTGHRYSRGQQGKIKLSEISWTPFGLCKKRNLTKLIRLHPRLLHAIVCFRWLTRRWFSMSVLHFTVSIPFWVFTITDRCTRWFYPVMNGYLMWTWEVISCDHD